MMRRLINNWFTSGEPWVWITAAAVGISICAVVGIIGLITVKGFGFFWPSDVALIKYQTSSGANHNIYGELLDTDRVPINQYVEANQPPNVATTNDTMERQLFKTGNRRNAPPDFRWLWANQILAVTYPSDIVVIERLEWGNVYGQADGLFLDNSSQSIPKNGLYEVLLQRVGQVNEVRRSIQALEDGPLKEINRQLEERRLENRSLHLQHLEDTDRAQAIKSEIASLQSAYGAVETQLRVLYEQLDRDRLVVALADETKISVRLAAIVRVWQPNKMSFSNKAARYLDNLWRFLTENPREANTEGGIFPAIFGTVLMVMLMAIVVTPLGVIAAIYLREYAHQGVFVRTIRIAVNNLAGVPSIVYGVFGLGFFVYFLGGNIDRLFYAEALPAPTFGTPGLMWASLTLALLTVPVVIVSTEEGLTRIPRSLREGSLALGATKSETLFKIVLPMASPAILTGVILAIARAAGEVAPLMLVGVVKLAPTLPLDGEFPFLHLDRKFMHLGFHIYDVGFQSPNVEAARPLVYATATLLIVIVVSLNLTAIALRSRLEKRYRNVES